MTTAVRLYGEPLCTGGFAVRLLLAMTLLFAPAIAGTISVEWDAVTYSQPITYEIENGQPTDATAAAVTVPDCDLADIRVRAMSDGLISDWSATLTAWPDIEVGGILPTEVNLSDGEIFIVIEGNNLPPDVDVQVGVEGEPSWQSTFTEADRTCTSVTGTLRLASNTTSGMELPLTLVSGDQSVLAGTVTVTVEVIPAPTGLRVVR